MDGERTFEQLAYELENVYGLIAGSVYSAYELHNPLKLDVDQVPQYWEITRAFLEHLHSVLYHKEHQLSIYSIKPESYYFLVKMCIDRSFTLSQLIDVRNDSDNKKTKDLANEIAHHVIPPYLTHRRQNVSHSYYKSNIVTPNQINDPNASFMQPPMQPPQMPFMYGPPQMPFMYGPPQMPMPMPFMYPHNPPVPPRPSMYATPNGGKTYSEPSKRRKPIIRLKPKCVRKGNEKDQLGFSIPLSENNDAPLNFYSVYCSDRATCVNNESKNHHVPMIFPVQNRPPPPN
jgi:hypothetical protein